jgi:penicillin amidase
MTALERMRRLAQGGLVALTLARRAWRRPPPRSVAERLAALPRVIPSAAAVTIHWNAHLIPFIEAASEADLAVGVGVVHAHLRLAQMEVLRRLSQGRLAEVLGPLALDLDIALRLLDFGRAVPGIIAAMAPAARAWAEGFLRGVNCVIAAGAPPPECDWLGAAPAPWTLEDLLTASRLAGADVNWLVWRRLLRSRSEMGGAAWQRLWPRLLGAVAPAAPDGAAETMLAAFARHGSNAAAVAGWRSRSGGALLAADPHLSVSLPNIWLAAGLHAPGLHAVGLMPAGFPIIAIGRNAELGWAGTSLHAASSELFDATGLKLHERRVRIRVRGAADHVAVLRESPLGPIVSDGLLLPHATPLALSWIGHRPSDEIGAMLGVMRAATPDQFRAALEGFALPGQNMLHAGRDGQVGHLLAARLPRRPLAPPADLVSDPTEAAAWERPVTTAELPHWRDPPAGFVASANDRPPEGVIVPAGFFFSPDDRVRRMRTLLGGEGRLGLEAMAALQQDVLAPGAPAVRDRLLARLGPGRSGHAVVRVLAAWDGRYAPDSAGALAYEALLGALAARLGRDPRQRAMAAIWTGRALFAEDIPSLPEVVLDPALAATARALRRWRVWGAVHRMRLRGLLGAVPLLGRRFTYGAWPSPGGNDTLNKAGNAPVRGRHAVSFGASARFLADMAEPDANRVVLLGGQDGWLGSACFSDQATLWREGAYVDLPLRLETARQWPHRSVLAPG